MNIFRRLVFSILLLSLIFVARTGALADEMFLRSGDKLTGTVIGKKGKYLNFMTRGGDEVSFLWKNVTKVKCDNAVVVDSSGRIEDGPFVITDRADAVDGDRILNKDEVKMLNPAPWRIGRGWEQSGYFNFSLISERGNTDKDNTDMDGSIMIRDITHRFAATLEMSNDAKDGVETQSKWFIYGRYDHFIRKKSYFSAATTFRNDKFANLKLRSTVGGGLGYQVFDDDATELFTEMLLVNVWENSADDVGTDYVGGMLQLKLDRELVAEKLFFFVLGAGTLNLTSTKDYFTDVTLGLRAPLFGGLVCTAEVKSEYDSEPTGDAVKSDHTYRLKVGYRW